MAITKQAADKISSVLKQTFKKPPTLSGKTECEKIVTVVNSIDWPQFSALSQVAEDMHIQNLLIKRSGTGVSITFS